MKQEILEELAKRPGVASEIVESLYEDAIQDIQEFCNLKEVNQKHKSTIKDLIMFRYNTLGTEGIKSESYPSVSYTYERDIPSRIKTKFKEATLMTFKSVSTPSGATKKTWQEEKTIKIAIHKVDEFYNPQGFKHSEVTHIGLTFERNIQARKNRITLNNVQYEILNVDNSHRLTHLTLKEYVNGQ